MKKKIPEFRNEDDERKFWAQADSTKYVDWPSGKRTKLVQLFLAERLARERQPPSGQA